FIWLLLTIQVLKTEKINLFLKKTDIKLYY
ncbi:MAG: hypothetical protein ACI88H_002639, partial [Cocleimonas sp.]